VFGDGQEIIDYVYQYGPFASGMFVESAFYHYSSGVYANTTNRLPDDHVVVVVGFGATANGSKYLIARNSWGSGWGMRGYFLVDLNNRCGIGSAIYGYFPVSVRPHIDCECHESTSCCDGCNYRPASTVCRPAPKVCDVIDYCDGKSAECPADQFRPQGYVCRLQAGACDIVEVCTGDSPVCPDNLRQPNGFVCRDTKDDCDVAEVCKGAF
jgi:hypothetical protein